MKYRKVLFAVLVALALVVGLVPGVFAAGEAVGFHPTKDITTTTTANMTGGTVFRIPLQDDAFVDETNSTSTDYSEIDTIDFAFQTYSNRQYFDAMTVRLDNGKYYIDLLPKADASVASISYWDYTLSINLKSTATNPGTLSRTGSIVSGSITPSTPANYLTGIDKYTNTTYNATSSTGTSATIDVNLTGITFYTTDNTSISSPSASDLADAFTVSSSNSNFSVSFTGSTSPYIRVTAPSGLSDGTYTTTITLTGGNGSVDIATINLTVGTVGKKITGINPDARLGETANGISGWTGHNGKEIDSLSGLDIQSGDEITFQFRTTFFEWDGATPAERTVTRSEISAGRVGVKVTKGNSSSIIDNVSIQYYNSEAYVRVKFANYTSTKDRDFEVTIAMTYNNSRTVSGTEAIISGVLSAEVIELYDDYEYVDLSDGAVAYAENSVKDVEFYLGEGVTAYASVSRGRSVSGHATIEPDSTDNDRMNRYPSITDVYNLKTSGFQSAKVHIDTGGTRYYVYDANLEYLGMSTDTRLPYSTKYYLSTSQITSDTAGTGTDDPVIEEPGTSNTFGSTPGGTYPANDNYNPVTGR